MKNGTAFSKTLEGNERSNMHPTIEPSTVKIVKNHVSFQCPFNSLVEEMVEPILVQIKAASLVTFA